MVIIVGCVWDLVVSSSSSTLEIMHITHQETIFLSIFFFYMKASIIVSKMIIDSLNFNSKNFVLYIIISIQPSPIKLYPPPPSPAVLIYTSF